MHLKAVSSDEESRGHEKTEGEGEWFSDLPDPGLPEGMQRQPKGANKKPIEPAPRSPDSGDEQANEVSGAKAVQLSKAHRIIRGMTVAMQAISNGYCSVEQYRRISNQPPLPPTELPPEVVLSSVQERSKPIFEEKCGWYLMKILTLLYRQKQLAAVGLRGMPHPYPSPAAPGLSCDSLDVRCL